MTLPLDEAYLGWLNLQIGSVEGWWELLKQLHTKEFVWIVPNDDNRVVDGVDLRYEFCAVHAVDPMTIRPWMEQGCSVLEMMVGLARRCAFEADGTPADWFWKMVENLNFMGFFDQIYRDRPYTRVIVDEALNALVFRTYEPNGQGGLFPLTDPDQDQRKVEIWYQLNAYLIEQG